MSEFILPHQHGESLYTADLYRELANVKNFEVVSEIFKQLSDPTRVRIFWILSHQEECVVNIASMLNMSSPAVSHHLRSLVESGLLESRRDGKEVYYRATDTKQICLLHEIVEQVMAIACPEKEANLNASQEEIIHNVHRYLIEHLSERITIEKLSHLFLMNTTTLKNAFKQVYGTTIAAHMRKHRMEQAALLLKTSSNEIFAIAQSVGYDSAGRFTTAFREMYGMTPTEFRKQYSSQRAAELQKTNLL